jgi:phosphate transport system permease protein
MTLQVDKHAAAAGAEGFLRQQRPRYGELAIKAVLFTAASVAVATTVAIVVALLFPTVQFFSEIPITDFLFGTTWTALFAEPQFGVIPLVTGTLVITAIACLIALPLGLGSAIYLSEYASQPVRKAIKPTLEVLEGIPTVVYGFFALTFLTPILQAIVPGDNLPGTFNALSAGLIMGVMIIPTVASISEDAMHAVPNSLRQGAFALGSNKRQVSTRVVVPAALSGIAAAFILGISRAIGETMIVTVAAGLLAQVSFNPLEQMSTMTAFIAAAGSGDVPTGSLEYKTIFAVGSLLFVFTLLLNLLSHKLVRKYREVYE